jgi:hypothetical protein
MCEEGGKGDEIGLPVAGWPIELGPSHDYVIDKSCIIIV